MRAIIEWLPKEEGGRSCPPAGVGSPAYATVVRFVDTDEPWPPQIAWSLVVRKIESQSDEYRWDAEVEYLMDDAPYETLRVGRPFELYEGNKCVAYGKLVDNESISNHGVGFQSLD